MPSPWTKIANGIAIGQKYKDRPRATTCETCDENPCTCFVIKIKRADYCNGRQRYLRVGPDRGAAVTVATQIIGELSAAGSSRATVSVVLDEYLREWCSRMVRSSTEELYEGLVRNHLKPALGTLPISSITETTLYDYCFGILEPLDRDQRALRLSTIQNQMTCLSAALNWYWRKSSMAGTPNPAHYCKASIRAVKNRLHIHKRKRRAIPRPDQIQPFLKLAWKRSPLVHDLYVIGFGTGLRIGEALGLRWCEVDWERCVFDDQGYGPRFKIGKRGKPELYKSEREAPVRFPRAMVAMLMRLRSSRKSDEWIFATRNGTPLSVRNASRMIYRVRESALTELGFSMGSTSFHGTRHVFSSLAQINGWSLAESREQVGHASEELLKSTYVHALAQDQTMEWAYFGSDTEPEPDTSIQ